jgi:ATP synthase protein I
VSLKYTFGAFCIGLVAKRDQMAVSLVLEGQIFARKVIIYQSILALIVALFCAIVNGKIGCISAVYGALTVIIPNFIYAYFAFKYGGARQNKLVVQSFSKGSKIKFITTIVLFALIYRWQNLDILALMVSYVTILVGQWPIMILISHVRHNK